MVVLSPPSAQGRRVLGIRLGSLCKVCKIKCRLLSSGIILGNQDNARHLCDYFFREIYNTGKLLDLKWVCMQHLWPKKRKKHRSINLSTLMPIPENSLRKCGYSRRLCISHYPYISFLYIPALSFFYPLFSSIQSLPSSIHLPIKHSLITFNQLRGLEYARMEWMGRGK